MKPLKKIYLLYFLSFLIFPACSKIWHEADYQSNNYSLSAEVEQRSPDQAALNQLIDPYRQQIAEEMGKEIAVLPSSLEKGYPEGTLGNWVADLLYLSAEDNTNLPVDFALSNSGGLRLRDIPAGPLTKGKLFELLPFDNELVIVDLPRDTLIILFDHIADYGGWPLSVHVKYRIVDKKAESVQIKGIPVQQKERFRVAMPDYVANGGSNCWFLKKCKQEHTGKLMRDAVADYLQENGTEKVFNTIKEKRVQS